ncbi:nuclear transport factor 2 family protein [Streptomyces sp. NBC_01166]|uniref:nuclear transport factor 2 family protein n=1 Tax=Streptomyces sp. NBC_01166 TaxID=2903755 RepID=UPI003866E48A|nr:nuclear transport factor 2 family protein [Streptomyces sp. NBC_01166]
MSEHPNVTLVRRLYESKMAPDVIDEIVDPELVWDITPGFPNGGVYQGWASVSEDFFGTLQPLFASLGSVSEEYLAAGDDHVVVLGHYHATTAAGAQADARFVHVWTVRGGKLTRLRQTADSHVLQQALAG